MKEAVELVIYGVSGFALISIAATYGIVYLIWNSPTLVASGLESSITHTIDTMPVERRVHLSHVLYDRVLARLAPLGFDDVTNQRILAPLALWT